MRRRSKDVSGAATSPLPRRVDRREDQGGEHNGGGEHDDGGDDDDDGVDGVIDDEDWWAYNRYR